MRQYILRIKKLFAFLLFITCIIVCTILLDMAAELLFFVLIAPSLLFFVIMVADIVLLVIAVKLIRRTWKYIKTNNNDSKKKSNKNMKEELKELPPED